MARYVEHLRGASSSAGRNAKIVDMALDQITISNGSIRWCVPLEPPMGSWKEARERLVRMDQDAIKALDRSDVTIKEYRLPAGFQLIIFALCLGGYISFLRKANFIPGSYQYEFLWRYIPAVGALLRDTYPLALVLMVGIHLVELIIFIRTRLTKHSVPFLSQLWWSWSISTFIEGFGAFQR